MALPTLAVVVTAIDPFRTCVASVLSLPATALTPGGQPLGAEEVPWTDIPAVRLLGTILGAMLLIAAIRSMFGGKGGKGGR